MEIRLLARMHILLLLLLCIGSSLYAQERTITGRVTDVKDGSPLSGVSVQPKDDPKRGTVTRSDGSFSLLVGPNTRSLVFSIIGYGSQEHPLASGPLTIALTASSSNLNEIVVIGYGTARKKDLTGAVTVIGEKDFQPGTITTPEQMITGKVPGVSIISNSGQPGAGSTIRLRGGSSLNAGNTPLIVLDGVPLDNEIQVGQKAAIAGSGNPL